MKITKLPPAPQTVFFQEEQFDPNIGSGTDPNQFYRGGSLNSGGKKGRGFKKKDDDKEVQTKAAKQMRKAKESLEGHPNKKAILKILKGTKNE